MTMLVESGASWLPLNAEAEYFSSMAFTELKLPRKIQKHNNR
jgi:hypothetical protein